jgi:hypothetical protein
VIAGDFFARVLAGAGCNILADVLHDWNGTESTLIRRNCRRAMPVLGLVERDLARDRVCLPLCHVALPIRLACRLVRAINGPPKRLG